MCSRHTALPASCACASACCSHAPCGPMKTRQYAILHVRDAPGPSSSCRRSAAGFTLDARGCPRWEVHFCREGPSTGRQARLCVSPQRLKEEHVAWRVSICTTSIYLLRACLQARLWPAQVECLRPAPAQTPDNLRSSIHDTTTASSPTNAGPAGLRDTCQVHRQQAILPDGGLEASRGLGERKKPTNPWHVSSQGKCVRTYCPTPTSLLRVYEDVGQRLHVQELAAISSERPVAFQSIAFRQEASTYSYR
ncbi:hypothetical protein DFH27DRAFT_633936 [Peziza echinospora]|nr:hypothetical protein DFH27DRAFT_633936 [Peziza echinospora]